ncbi:hypothetical protein D3C85_1174930 [compost metagenome]
MQRGPVVHLECRQRVDRGSVQGAVLRACIAQPLQLFLEPGHVGRALRLQACQVFGGACFVVPAAYACRGQRLPGKERARIYLALRRDVAVAHDVFGGDAVALDDVSQQDGQGVYLAVVVGVPDGLAVRAFGPARIDDLDADGRAVHGDVAVPGAGPGMPGGAVLVDEPIGAPRIVHQVMGADLAFG